MGRLLEKYYSENNNYPKKLEELYPKYLANKSLIEEVNWEYKPSKDNFMLKKAIVVDGERLDAAIDKESKTKKRRSDNSCRSFEKQFRSTRTKKHFPMFGC